MNSTGGREESGISQVANDFDAIADVYDDLVSWAPYGKWVRDLLRRLRRHGLRRGQRILDVACGTGLSSIPLAAEGYSVVGVDRSERMLEQARKKVAGTAPDVQFVRGDILALELPWTFDAAICMHSGLDYILDREDLAQAFRSLRGQLRQGGLLAFDKCLDEPEFYGEPRSDVRHLPCGMAVFHYSWDRKRKFFDQRCVVTRSGARDGPVRTDVLHRMLAVPVTELIEMVEAARFELLEPPRRFTVSDPGMGIFRAV